MNLNVKSTKQIKNQRDFQSNVIVFLDRNEKTEGLQKVK